MANTTEITGFADALKLYIDAKQEHDKARESFDGYDWGYHGYDLIRRVDDAAEDMQKSLEKVITIRVLDVVSKILKGD